MTDFFSFLDELHQLRASADNAALAARLAEQGNRLPALPEGAERLGAEEIAALYHYGAHDILLALQALAANSASSGRYGNLPSSLLARLAIAIHFSRQEPEKALPLTELVEERLLRRLCQKTAGLWPRVFAPAPEELAAPPRVHLLVLTYNRAEYVEHALRELGRTAYPNLAVYIADNGSKDGTREIVARAKDFFPPEVPVHIELLPTNLGRPIGHNWLLTKFDHSAAEFIAIGDDDLTLVPPSWLRNLVMTAKQFPGAGCVGCKAVDGGNPAAQKRMVHGIAIHIDSFKKDGISIDREDHEEDLGQFDNIEIADHVIGCLNIYKREVFEKAGLFDISLSPCQFVDVEHHVRMALAGYQIVFNGLVQCEHLKAMGKSSKNNRALRGNLEGNMIKILNKHDAGKVKEALDAAHLKAEAWLRAC